MKKTLELIPGILFVLGISFLSIFTNDLLKQYINLEALTIAIIIGIVYNNTLGTQNLFNPGVKFSLKKLLKVGIVLLGFKLDFGSLMTLGPRILTMILVYVPLTLFLSYLLGKKLKVNEKLSTLIGVGSCICGASAVVAMAPCIDADEEDAVIAVSIVSFLGAVGVLVYSGIATGVSSLTPLQYGAWSGLTLHGVAHAIAAAFALGDASGEIGTFVKMGRVLMLVPVSVFLSYVFNKGCESGCRPKFPMYVVYFIMAGIINSAGLIPGNITGIFVKASSMFILMAMTAMGLSVDFKSIRNKGVKALLAGTIVFIIMSTIGFVVITHII
jgi:uncharacterized integral membrane protein (TIGR00698 family)